TRHERIKQPRDYLGASTTIAREGTVAPAELPFEFMLNALRLIEGFPPALFQERTGLPITAVQAQLAEAERKGLIERDWQRLRPTERGRLFLNELLALFVGGESAGRGSGVRVAGPATRTSQHAAPQSRAHSARAGAPRPTPPPSARPHPATRSPRARR